MATTSVSIADFAAAVIEFSRALYSYEEEINGLNVYPVPDGDTGTNLKLSLAAVVRELEGSTDPCASIARGSLMGARGNSGVILSQLFRGLSEAVGESDILSPATLADGLRRGSDLAYKAVMQPQEGTILTVAREAAEEAEAASSDRDDLVDACRRVVGRAQDALDRTPELLPILKHAGVVDAGGRGFLLFLECLLFTLDATPLPPPRVPAKSPADAIQGATALDTEGGSLEFKFEVQFLYEVTDAKADEYREVLGRYGDCVLVVGNAGLYNVHVHTNAIGEVIEEAYERGRPRQLEVQYLEGQVNDLAAGSHRASVLAHMQEGQDDGGPVEHLGIVAVAAGDGILEIFASLGVRGLVSGGQTFNPSAEEILVGIRRARAEEVIVLPNNKNVISSARTAAGIATDEGIVKRIDVVPTESPLQGITAIVAFDRDASLDDNLVAMTTEALATKHGEVAYAVRTSETPAGHVEEGQALGIAGGSVRFIGDDADDAVLGVVEAMLDPESDSLVTLVYGADVDEWHAHALGKRVGERFAVEVEVHRGGQPHYPFLIGIE